MLNNIFGGFLENIALKKSAWQLHPYEHSKTSESVNASKAVDGLKTNLSFEGQQCTVSANYKYEAEWRVDLGAVLGIHHITIYYRTDNAQWGKKTESISVLLNRRCNCRVIIGFSSKYRIQMELQYSELLYN